MPALFYKSYVVVTRVLWQDMGCGHDQGFYKDLGAYELAR